MVKYSHIDIYPIIVIAFIIIPLLIKLILHGTLFGTDSKRNKFITSKSFGHFIIAFLSGLLMSPVYLASNEKDFIFIRSLLTIFLTLLYPVYNIIKRSIKHKSNFFQSSFFINLNDILMGILIGNILGLIIYKNQKNKKKFGVEKNIKIITYIILSLWLFIVLYEIIKTM
tara:strand:- start:1708 stop:2217 length:510 start_codon:yes stop_codon:yes gene_type:complete